MSLPPLLRRAALAAIVAGAVAVAGCTGGDTAGTTSAATTAAARTATEAPPSTTTRGAPTVATAPLPDQERVTLASIPGIVRRVQPSVVAIIAQVPGGEGEGSGVIWSEDGLVVTNEHVVDGATRLTVVLASGERLPARVVAADRRTDLAVVKVARDGLPPATFATQLPEVGALALAMGNPLGFESSVTQGIVSGLHRAVPSGGQTPALVDLIQTDAGISPGNSGGALVGADGRVIGINVAYIPPQSGAESLGFAIPSPTVISAVEQLVSTGRVRHSYMGIDPEQVTPELAAQFGLPAEEGVLVTRATPGGPAARAGVRAGDVIVAAGGTEIRTVEDLYAVLREREPGERLVVTVRRGERTLDLEVTLGELPAG